ncbi:penicillin-binding protein 1F [Variibacter gotjawalensis]|uniref:peptidoglycan glycosyltransferase n=1 Tax=Variibacter gotjawalensis TaxID=1333996 RepID=A0A0S3PWV1_9BRAD|nr:penicillin-binding protein 1C [Variibacter gotjawalensis]NIK46245.1 penicillin-binding protein 1C [Variibacter gotjawalensis]RZS48160.1 penicillin-binding protein 1C [Variibacter gotjawalensis]BAT60417.1 penicillin-binding protein 1F [Variibacter gotjawalensis]
MRFIRKRWRWLVAGFAASLAVAFVAGVVWVKSLGPAPLGEGLEFSTLVLDREGRMLRPYATADGRWRLPVSLANVDPRYVETLIAYEDKRFRDHRGVDAFALGRAAWQLVTNGRIVSGGSTLSMQVARLLEPRAERSFAAKARQIVRAVQLESALTKDEIVNLYLNLAPFGGNLEGVRAASFAYFNKEPKRLSLAETALLVALPQSPEARRPDRSVAVARAARDRVLDRIAESNLVWSHEVDRARMEAVTAQRHPMPALAAHAADNAIHVAPDRRVHSLTIEAPLQKALEQLAKERAPTIGPEISIAIVVVDNATGEVLSRVASADYFDDKRAGQVDLSQALRSPGSTLKPFIYGLGFEDGLIHPETLIEDRPRRYGSYAPENFDMTFQGTVTVRKALQSSLNVPAIAVLDAVRSSRFTARLTQAGAGLVLPDGEIPGLAMGLGGVGIRLTDLTMLYAGVARLGNTITLTERLDSTEKPTERRLLEPAAAWQVGNVLLGTAPPLNAAPGRIAYKTGTSYGYRDAWSVGFDGKRTVGVWVGRPDGAPVPGMLGRTAAAPILFDAFARMGKIPSPLPAAPRGVLTAATDKLPPPLQQFRGLGEEVKPQSSLRIMFPPNGARLDLSSPGGLLEQVALKVSGGNGALTLLANGIPVGTSTKRTVFWTPDGPGFVRLTITDSNGAAESVMVRVQ